MTYKEKLQKTTNWKTRILIINLYHKIQVAKHSTWLLQNTAKYFGISIGQTSEAIKLAENIHLVGDCKSRKQALVRLK